MDVEQKPKGTTTAIIAYLSFIGTIIALFINSDDKYDFAAFHTRQAIGINIIYLLILSIIAGFNSWYITLPFWIFLFTLWSYGFIGATQGRKTIVPLVGTYFQKWFKKITA